MPPRRRAVLLCGPARATLAAVARALAGPGRVLLVQAAPRQRAATARLTRGLGRTRVRIVEGSLGGDADAQNLIRQAWSAAGAIDTVVICASAPGARADAEPSLDAWRAGLDVGLRGPFFAAKQAGLRLATRGGRLIFAVAAPPPASGPVADVVQEGLRCMVDALARAVPDRVAVCAVIGGGRTAAARIAAGVRFFCEADRRSTGALLDLGTHGR